MSAMSHQARRGPSTTPARHRLGASRQRVNQELKSMEREGVIRVEPTGLVVCDRDALLRIGEE